MAAPHPRGAFRGNDTLIPVIWEGEQGGDGLQILLRVLQDAAEISNARGWLLNRHDVVFLS